MSTLDKLQLSLRINSLLSQVDANLFDKCMKEIILKLFGGNSSLLKFIINSANKQQLAIIHTIIKQKKIEQTNKKITKSIIESDTNHINDEQIKNNNNKFEILPNECIHHICGYLNKWNVLMFKMTSRQIAIVCLEEMNKITISTMISHKLKNNDFESHLQNIQQDRYNSSTLFYILQEQWYKIYGIPQENQLIFKMKNENSKSTKGLFPKPINMKKLRLSNVITGKYLICDNRNIIVLNGNYGRKFDIKHDVFDKIKHYKLMILEYFDITKQSANIVQFILYKPYQTFFYQILDYIEHTMLKNTDIHKNLMNYLKEMEEDPNHRKLLIFEQTAAKRDLKLFPLNDYVDQNLYTFQLNHAHKSFDKLIHFNQVQIDWFSKDQIAELCAARFHSNLQNIHICIKNEKAMLTSCIDRYYESRFNEMERQIFKCDFTEKCRSYWYRKTMKMNIKSPALWLKKKISQLFDNIIEPQYIEIYKKRYFLRNSQSVDEARDDGIEWITGYVVLYDTEKMDELERTEQILYGTCFITIFEPKNQCSFPFYDNDENTGRIMLRYRADWTFQDLLNHLFHVIYEGTDSILYDRYKHLLNECVDGFDIDDDDCDMKQSGNHEYRLSDKIDFIFTDSLCFCSASIVPIISKIFELNDTLSSQRGNDFDLFIMRILPSPLRITMNVKLIIRFILNTDNDAKITLNIKTDRKNIKHLEFIGLPLVAWIKPNDSLQKIIDEYMYKSRKYIKSCYGITEDNILSIPSSKWNDYCPYWRFLWNSPNNFLILKMKKNLCSELVISKYWSKLYGYGYRSEDHFKQ